MIRLGLLALCFTSILPSTHSTTGSSTFVQPFPMPKCHGLPLEEAPVDTIQGWLSSGKLTSVKLVGCFLERIHQIDRHVGAIMEVNPDVMDIAQHLDEERLRGKIRGPLHGIPVLVKDNIGTKDKMQTTAGSLALLGSVIPRDAHVVKLLRDAGAIILGHGNMSEWADMRSTSYSEGFSPRRGQTRNSYNLTQEPGGSSSGPGHAVTTNMVVLSYGTETDGSIISPAERANIVGIKPTVGLTSRAGVIPESRHQDTVGAFGRSVKDAVFALDAIVGVDERDEATWEQKGKARKNYTQFLARKDALKGAKFGLPWTRIWDQSTTKGQLPTLLSAIQILESHGATVYNNTNYRDPTLTSPAGWNWKFGSQNESEFTYVQVDFYNDIAKYLSELQNTTIRSVEDIIAFNDRNTRFEGGFPNTNPAFASGQDNLLLSALTKGEQNSTYHEALSFCRRTSREEGIDYALRHELPDGTFVQLDALLTPSDDSGPATSVPAQAGYPIITIPIGIDEWHSPFGMSFVGTAWSEPVLIRFASAASDALGDRRVKPTFYEIDAKNIPVNFGPSE